MVQHRHLHGDGNYRNLAESAGFPWVWKLMLQPERLPGE